MYRVFDYSSTKPKTKMCIALFKSRNDLFCQYFSALEQSLQKLKVLIRD